MGRKEKINPDAPHEGSQSASSWSVLTGSLVGLERASSEMVLRAGLFVDFWLFFFVLFCLFFFVDFRTSGASRRLAGDGGRRSTTSRATPAPLNEDVKGRHSARPRTNGSPIAVGPVQPPIRADRTGADVMATTTVTVAPVSFVSFFLCFFCCFHSSNVSMNSSIDRRLLSPLVITSLY